MRLINILLVLLLCLSTMHADLVIKRIGDDPTSAFTPSGVMVNTKELKERNPVDGNNGLTIKYGSEKKCLFSDEDVTIQGVMKGSPSGEDEGLKIHNNENAYLVDDVGNIYSSKVKQLGMDNGLLHNRVWATYYNEAGATKPMKTVSFYDGFGRNIQSQVKTKSSKWLIDATIYDEKSMPQKAIYSTPDYTIGLYCDTLGEALTNVASDYHNTSVPYLEIELDKIKPSVKKRFGATEKYAKGSGNYYRSWDLPIDRNSNIPNLFEGTGFLKSSILPNFDSNDEFGDELQLVLETNLSDPQYYLHVSRADNGQYTQTIIDKEGKVHADWVDLLPDNHDAGVVITTTTYDDEGRVKEVQSGDGSISPTTYTYNSQNLIETISHPDNGITTYTYNEFGNLDVVTSNPGTLYEMSDKTIYDTLGRGYEFQITDIANGITDFLMISRVFFDHANYNVIPNADQVPHLDEVVNSLTFTRGAVAGHYSFDCYNNSFELNFFSYDKDGNLITSYKYLSGIGWLKSDFEYTFTENLKKATTTHFWRAGNATSEHYSYYYDDEDNLVGFGSEEIDTIVSYSYNLTGELISKTYYNTESKIVAKYDVEYNAFGAAWKMQMLNRAGNVIYTQKMKYENPADEMISGIDHNSSLDKDISHTYTYDKIGQLTNVATEGDNGELDESFAYDNAGRFDHKSRGGSDGYNYSYEYIPGTNKLKKVGDREFSYDARGNLIHDIGKNVKISYSYDDYPILFETAEGLVKMRYDSDGNRYLKEESTLHSNKKTLYLGNSVYVSENDQPYVLAYKDMPMGEGTFITYENELHSYFYAKDHLGSVRGMISDDGTLVGLNHYTAYGERIVAKEAPEMFRYSFLGKEFDTEGGDENNKGGIGYYHLDARYYDPVIGVFLSTDPLDVYYNSYTYTSGNPIIYSDPSGKSPIVAGMIAGMVIGGTFGGLAAGKDATPAERFVGIFGGAAIMGGLGAAGGLSSLSSTSTGSSRILGGRNWMHTSIGIGSNSLAFSNPLGNGYKSNSGINAMIDLSFTYTSSIYKGFQGFGGGGLLGAPCGVPPVDCMDMPFASGGGGSLLRGAVYRGKLSQRSSPNTAPNYNLHITKDNFEGRITKVDGFTVKDLGNGKQLWTHNSGRTFLIRPEAKSVSDMTVDVKVPGFKKTFAKIRLTRGQINRTQSFVKPAKTTSVPRKFNFQARTSSSGGLGRGTSTYPTRTSLGGGAGGMGGSPLFPKVKN